MSKTKSWYMDLLDSFDELYQVATKSERSKLRKLWQDEDKEPELVELLSRIKGREVKKK
jgi:hypothetical protein